MITIDRRIEMIHNEILIYIAYKEGLLNKDDYIDYIKSQIQTITSEDVEILKTESEEK